MAIVQEEEGLSICTCATTSGYCCEGETDLLATSVYYLTAALKARGGADYTDPSVLSSAYRLYASFLSDAKAAAYSMQLARCLAEGIGATVETQYYAAKAAAKGFQSKFSLRDLTMIQGILMWLLIEDCMCRDRQ